jgi:hypothetical protein
MFHRRANGSACSRICLQQNRTRPHTSLNKGMYFLHCYLYNCGRHGSTRETRCRLGKHASSATFCTPEAALWVFVRWKLISATCYRSVEDSRPVSFTAGAWQSVYAMSLSRLQRETSKRHVGEAHSVLTAAILLHQRLSCWGKIVSLRMRVSTLSVLTAAILLSQHLSCYWGKNSVTVHAHQS